MKELIEQQKAKISELEDENRELYILLKSQSQKIESLQRMIFGKKSEKHLPVDPNQLVIEFDKLDIPEAEKKNLTTITEEIKIESHTRRIAKTKTKQDPAPRIPDSIERRNVILEPEGLDLSKYEKIGEDVREILEFTPGEFYVNRFIRPKYKLKESTTLNTTIIQAGAHESFISNSYAGDSVLAELLVGKYIDHLPIYRQVEIFKRNGMNLSYSTVNSWVHQVATNLYPLYDVLVKQVLSSSYIQVDETVLPVVRQESSRAVKAYIWGVNDVNNKQLFFHYDGGSRAQRVVLSLLHGYKGYIQTDGYEAYNVYDRSDGITHIACWAHVRRKFEQALKEDEEKANVALEYIRLLYEVEANNKFKELSSNEVLLERQRLSYPIMRSFESWMEQESNRVLPKSLLGKAIAYTYKLKFQLAYYVKDPQLMMDNNLIENTIRPIALGRKNYLFCQNDQTAKNTALFYSFFASCKMAGINPKEWIIDILARIKDTKCNDLVDLLPQNWKH